MSKSRAEAFSDGIFAIAITLLVLTVAQPSNYRKLISSGTRWSSLAANVVGFIVIGIMWLNHRSVTWTGSRNRRHVLLVACPLLGRLQPGLLRLADVF